MHQLARLRRNTHALITPRQHQLWVDSDVTAAAIQTGSRSYPFKTIQQAIDMIPEAFDSATTRAVNLIRIVSGTYDEDLTVDITRRRIMLVAVGTWNLGLFDSTTWQPSGTRRNITIEGDPTTFDNIRSYFGIVNMIEVGNRGGAVSSSFTAPRISGQITSPIAGPNDNIEMDIEAEIYGRDGGETGTSIDLPNNATVTMNMIRAHIRGQIVGGSSAADSNLNLSRCYQSRFRGDVTVGNVALVRECDCEENWTVSPNLTQGGAVLGFIDSIFEGVMDGDNNLNFVMRLDSYTQSRMLAQGGTIINSFKEFRDSTPTLTYTAGAAAPTSGQYLEANAGIAGTAGTLAIGRRGPVPIIGTLNLFTWESASADATTEMVINVGGADVGIVRLTGTSGSIVLGDTATLPTPFQPQVTGGALIGIRWNGNGTAPGNMIASVYQQ